MKKRQDGFTLVELLIVIAIIAILAVIVAPNIIRYIDKARKAVDRDTAEQIYKATQLAMASSNDDAYNGWSVCADMPGYPAVAWATDEGYGGLGTSGGDYTMRPVAWCRGINKNNYQNTYFKATLDKSVINGVDYGKMQRAFTNEMLHCFMQDRAKDGIYGVNREVYDGKEGLSFFGFKYKKSIHKKDGSEIKPECWIIYRRDDNGAPEIWIGYKSGYVQPICRVFPEPSDEYSP